MAFFQKTPNYGSLYTPPPLSSLAPIAPRKRFFFPSPSPPLGLDRVRLVFDLQFASSLVDGECELVHVEVLLDETVLDGQTLLFRFHHPRVQILALVDQILWNLEHITYHIKG